MSVCSANASGSEAEAAVQKDKRMLASSVTEADPVEVHKGFVFGMERMPMAEEGRREGECREGRDRNRKERSRVKRIATCEISCTVPSRTISCQLQMMCCGILYLIINCSRRKADKCESHELSLFLGRRHYLYHK